MRMLITSGGTKVPIDPVRSINNMSTGRFGMALASAALREGAEVTYLVSTDGKSPFADSIDFYQHPDETFNSNKFNQLKRFCERYRDHYREYRYNNFYDYAAMLEDLVKKGKPDFIFLSAAVSDYLVSEYAQDKIRSGKNINIPLELAPKVIHNVKTWSQGSIVVGFKLLVDAAEQELVAAAVEVIKRHHVDLVIANNLSSIQRGSHEILLVEPDGKYEKYQENIAAEIIKNILKRYSQ